MSRFAGSMYGATVDAMVTDPVKHVGHAAGKLRVLIDRDHAGVEHRRWAAQGRELESRRLIGEPLIIGRLDIEASPAVLQINEAQVSWARTACDDQRQRRT